MNHAYTFAFNIPPDNTLAFAYCPQCGDVKVLPNDQTQPQYTAILNTQLCPNTVGLITPQVKTP